MITPINRISVLMSLQRALLGSVTSSMRVVDVCWDSVRIHVRIVLEIKCDLCHEEIADDIEAEVEGDFLPLAKVTVLVQQVPLGIVVDQFKPFEGECARAFARREVCYDDLA
jgi:hypothetical protein